MLARQGPTESVTTTTTVASAPPIVACCCIGDIGELLKRLKAFAAGTAASRALAWMAILTSLVRQRDIDENANGFNIRDEHI